MNDLTRIRLADLEPFAFEILSANGFGANHATAIARMLGICQTDDCRSHGLFRLFMCVDSIRAGQVDGHAEPLVQTSDKPVVHVDACDGVSLLAARQGLDVLIDKTREHGIAALAVRNCFHFSALWPEVEYLAHAGLAGLSMLPSHSWVAPAGGTRGTLGTNPISFSWPRGDRDPFTFDFATSQFARGEIELFKRAGRPLPDGVAIDRTGAPTTDPEAALDGAMLTFGGYKGSALSIMIELLAGPLINDLTSLDSMAFARGEPGAPRHGQIIIAFDPFIFSQGKVEEGHDRAERLFADIIDQGARLPSQRRYEARARNRARDYVEIATSLHKDLLALYP